MPHPLNQAAKESNSHSFLISERHIHEPVN